MREMQLRPGESASITLPGLGSAGYQWFCAVEHEAVASVVKGEGDAGKPAGMHTQSSDEFFTVTAHAEGKTKMHFIQKRAFPSSAPVSSTYDLLVRVRPQ